MLFNTIDFVVFLPIVVFIYYLLPQKGRWILLLLASYFFYGSWKLNYLAFIIISTVIDYACGLKMDEIVSKKKKKPFLILSLVSNLGLLFFFKYYNFFAENLNSGIASNFPILEDVILPVGISFYTFQTLSYSVDVYHGRQKAESHLGYFALYVSFFPQLVAGPIERFSNLTPQFKTEKKINYQNISNGLRLILFGLFIKMVIADNVSGIVEKVYETPLAYSSWDVILSSFLYSFQIYSDFFGYSTIAIGSARLLGINLMDNFKTPYLSRNIAEFWQRWHISLSTWFRDYLYYPMGGNRVNKFKWYLNVLTIFIVSGIWHGANWTFIFWGALFGIVYILEKLASKYIAFAKGNVFFNALLILKTFLLTTLIWVFFRSQSIDEAFEFLSRIFEFSSQSEAELIVPLYVWFSLSLFIISEFLLFNSRFDEKLNKIAFPLRWTIYSILLFSILVFSGVDDFPFIYFQF
jgi:alginate O-acetyltransferase complex protein AlgI